MKHFAILIFLLSILCCSPKGPQTYDSPFIGKTKTDLIAVKGLAKKIKIFDNSEAHIYITREEYFGKKTPSNNKKLSPKEIVEIEHIYYINKKGYIYKYQIWKKKIK